MPSPVEDALREHRAASVEKFGGQSSPWDPIFFDPTPTARPPISALRVQLCTEPLVVKQDIKDEPSV
jgi:hypothetical protein